jgi:hypothetical protein
VMILDAFSSAPLSSSRHSLCSMHSATSADSCAGRFASTQLGAVRSDVVLSDVVAGLPSAVLGTI